MTLIYILLFASYILGSIPFGLLLTRMAGLGDLRKVGSGNIGATNAMRTGRKWLGISTLLLDAGKGYASVALAYHFYDSDFVPLAGLFAVLGHVFPVWLKFKGGKGVATAIGVFFAMNPMLGLAVCSVWLLVFIITRTSSLSSLLSIGWAAVFAYIFCDMFVALLCLSISIIITFTHHNNIKRLLQGKELGFGKKPS